MNYSSEEMYEILQAGYRNGELENGKPVLLYSDDNGVDVYATEDESMTGFAKLHLFVNNEPTYEVVSFVELFKDEDMCFDPDIEELSRCVNWLVHEIACEDYYPDWVFLPEGTGTEDDYTTDELNELVDDRRAELMSAFVEFLDVVGVADSGLREDPFVYGCLEQVLSMLSFAFDEDIYFPGWVLDESGDEVFTEYALGRINPEPYLGGCDDDGYDDGMTTTERLERRMLGYINQENS